MNPRMVLLTLILTGLLVGCRNAEEQTGSDDAQQDQEGVVQLDPELPTGVHLQAVLEMPETLNGVPTVHEDLRYLVYLPEGYAEDPDREWPMIFFLHGSGDEDYDSTFVLSFGLPAVLLAEEQPEDFPFIVISPQAWPGETWWTPEIIPALGVLLDEVSGLYRVDTDRVYLTGLSMGGYGSWWVATAYPERFAAMVSISGSGYRTPFLPEPETTCRLVDTPMWAIHGALDQISDARVAEITVASYEQLCSTDAEWTLYEDVGHIGAYERAYRDPALYEWLLQQSN